LTFVNDNHSTKLLRLV